MTVADEEGICQIPLDLALNSILNSFKIKILDKSIDSINNC